VRKNEEMGYITQIQKLRICCNEKVIYLSNVMPDNICDMFSEKGQR
jgi:hypothetical protein